ncbi:hypothetical protein U1Q18_001498, partial [Sarracenia purpurea var. burkii]
QIWYNNSLVAAFFGVAAILGINVATIVCSCFACEILVELAGVQDFLPSLLLKKHLVL